MPPGRPRNPDAFSPAERTRRARGKRAGTVALTVEAAADLDALRQPEEPRTVALARVLRDTAARPARSAACKMAETLKRHGSDT